MKNSKLKSHTGKHDNALKIAEKIVDWKVKNQFLTSQISSLERLKDFPVIGTSAFLLKAQLVEFELKQLISSLDLHALFTHQLWWKRKKARTPVQLDKQKLTLGGLKKEIEKYKFEFLKDLNAHLIKLVELRNEFVHSLFNLGSIKDLIVKSERGLRSANKVIEDIRKINTYLERMDPLK